MKKTGFLSYPIHTSFGTLQPGTLIESASKTVDCEIGKMRVLVVGGPPFVIQVPIGSVIWDNTSSQNLREYWRRYW